MKPRRLAAGLPTPPCLETCQGDRFQTASSPSALRVEHDKPREKDGNMHVRQHAAPADVNSTAATVIRFATFRTVDNLEVSAGQMNLTAN
jgi:hypothetical protein